MPSLHPLSISSSITHNNIKDSYFIMCDPCLQFQVIENLQLHSAQPTLKWFYYHVCALLAVSDYRETCGRHTGKDARPPRQVQDLPENSTRDQHKVIKLLLSINLRVYQNLLRKTIDSIAWKWCSKKSGFS